MNRGLLMLAGHAIYQNGRWHGGHPGEDAIYEEHVRDALRLVAAEDYQALVLSGGRSRPYLPPAITNSEAEGMRDYAIDAGLMRAVDPVLLETFGRDSFENVFFSMLCFHCRFGEWPSRVGAVSWKFKALRFYLIACGLRLADGRFRFFGSGDPCGAPVIEDLAAGSVKYDAAIVRDGEIIDPLHRNAHSFAAKRAKRTPHEFATNAAYLERVKQEYGSVQLMDAIELLQPGLAWREINWPWSEHDSS